MISNLNIKTKSLLYELDLNSRRTNSKIAKSIGISKEVVNYQIKKLEKEGIIQNYSTIIDTTKLGYTNTRTILELIDLNEEIEKEIINFLVKEDNVFFVIQFKGSFNISFGFLSKEIYPFQRFIDKFKNKFAKHISSLNFAFYDSLYHFHRKYLVKNPKDSLIKYKNSKKIIKYDNLDIQILKKLSENARISLTELSKRLNYPITTISSRIKNLEKKEIILGYTTLLSSSKLGRNYFKIDMKLFDMTRIKSILQHCHDNPNIIYFMKSTGEFDVEFFVEIENLKDLMKIIEEIRTNIGGIRDWKYSTSMKYYKFQYF